MIYHPRWTVCERIVEGDHLVVKWKLIIIGREVCSLVFLAMLILSAYCCSSAVLVEDDMEFPMNPYIRRRLYDGYTNNALTASQAASIPCEGAYAYCTISIKALSASEVPFSPCGRRNDHTPSCTEKCKNRPSLYLRVNECK